MPWGVAVCRWLTRFKRTARNEKIVDHFGGRVARGGGGLRRILLFLLRVQSRSAPGASSRTGLVEEGIQSEQRRIRSHHGSPRGLSARLPGAVPADRGE